MGAGKWPRILKLGDNTKSLSGPNFLIIPLTLEGTNRHRSFYTRVDETRQINILPVIGNSHWFRDRGKHTRLKSGYTSKLDLTSAETYITIHALVKCKICVVIPAKARECFHRRWFVFVFCLSVTTITKKLWTDLYQILCEGS